MSLCPPNLCTGCGTCRNICPVDAISLNADAEGFLQPTVDQESCTQCGLCEQHCPVLHPLQLDRNETPEVYAAWHKDKAIRMASSSGGAFSAIAHSVLEENGVVFGAAYDKHMSVSHRAVSTVEELHLLRGSKYVQSDIGFSFREVKQYLLNGRRVLFVGTPCQVAGLYAYLKKPYPSLVTCDFICHGVPSPALFEYYLDWLAKPLGGVPADFNFRAKNSGWYDALRTCKVNGKEIRLKGKHDAYFVGFNKNVTLRESCYRCPSIGVPRKGDITLADFWGLGMEIPFSPKKEIHSGISLLLLNSQTGRDLFEQRFAQSLIFEKRSFAEALKRNQPMVEPSKRPKARDTFYKELAVASFDDVQKKYCSLSFKASCVAWARENLPRGPLMFVRNFLQK